jgi:hypothetical protein
MRAYMWLVAPTTLPEVHAVPILPAEEASKDVPLPDASVVIGGSSALAVTRTDCHCASRRPMRSQRDYTRGIPGDKADARHRASPSPFLDFLRVLIPDNT